MPYELRFKTEAVKEWDKLGATVRAQFKKKLAERLNAPHVPAARLTGSVARYKIKLSTAGFRLVYEVRDAELVVVVIAVGKRERGHVYRKAQQRYD
ncbi:MAG: type II toxin-antitoxin system RelE/ParE family toxin [Alphaproteobacteria bacterium]|jgi:mRNA interferase RelE/StbE|nr:type II toxin-antitoxin system RelE/ParE family toxin [Alphaproteobacteria bacterium]